MAAASMAGGLAGGNGGQVRSTVADVHAEQACQTIQVLVAVAVV